MHGHRDFQWEKAVEKVPVIEKSAGGHKKRTSFSTLPWFHGRVELKIGIRLLLAWQDVS